MEETYESCDLIFGSEVYWLDGEDCEYEGA